MNSRAYITLITTATMAIIAATAQRQRTTMRGPLRVDTPAPAETIITTSADIPGDSITDNLDQIVRLAGYDKPISASRESMHVTNLSDTLTIKRINFEIRYLDKSGRELHRRDVTLNHTIAPGRTELVTFPTWDIQRSFYYVLSVKPSRQATPYDINCTINSITIIQQP